MTDNSDIARKLEIRQMGISLIQPPFSVLDMYSGEGHITSQLWSKIAQSVVCIEKEKNKFSCKQSHVSLINDDCRKHYDLCRLFNVIDCDAHGMVAPVLEQVIEQCRRDTIIFFTEFNPILHRIKIDWTHKFIDELINHKKVRAIWYEKSKLSPVLYGYALI